MNKIKPTIEVIVNYNINDYDILSKDIDINQYQIYSDSPAILDFFSQRNYSVIDLKEYFGSSNPRLFASNDRSVSNVNEIINITESIKYQNVRIIDGLKFQFVKQMIFFDKIDSICQKGTNALFLFRNFIPQFFGIIDISDFYNYETIFGVSQIINLNLVQVDAKYFRRKHKKYYPLFENLEDIPQTPEADLTEIISKLKLPLDKINLSNPKIGFFLVNDIAKYYLKSVYPLLEKFRDKENEVSIFTFYKLTKEELTELGFDVHHLADNFNPFTPRSKKISNKTQNWLLKNYFKHLSHHENIRRILMPFSILIYDPEEELSVKLFKHEITVIKEFFQKLQQTKFDNIVLVAFVRNLLNDITINLITKSIIEIILFHRLLKNSNFKSIFVSYDGSTDNDLICQIAKLYNIQTFTIPSGLIRFSSINTFFMHASKLFISGPRVERNLLDLGIDKNRLLITGNPRYDYIKKSSESDMVEIEQKILSSHNKLILVATSRWRINDEEWMIELIKFANKINVDIVIKAHPTYKLAPERRETHKEKKLLIDSQCQGLKYDVTTEGTLENFYKKADVVITENSSSGLEAILTDIPMIIFNQHIVKDDESSRIYIDEKVAKEATTYDELLSCVEQILTDPQIQQELSSARKKFIFDYNFLNDGHATDRIFDIIYQTIIDDSKSSSANVINNE